jgi:histidine triad (HIT) family protein
MTWEKRIDMGFCIFCDIIAGERSASVVYEDSLVVVILDINPVTLGHLLVIPRQHVAEIGDMDECTGAHMFLIATRLSAALRRSSVRCEAINMFLADGEAAGQEIFHVHLHVFPRFKGDTVRIEADWSAHPARDELDRTANLIRSAYEVSAD